MRRSFYPDFAESDSIHRPLAIHSEEMRETRCAKKAVLASRLLHDMKSLDHFEAAGEYASISLSRAQTHSGLSSVCLKTPTKLDHWPRAYGRIYSISGAYLKIDDEDWSAYNRLSFYVKADMPGFRSISFRMQVHNGGDHPVPDRYDREGHHNINLKDGEWTLVQVEIPYLHRDHIIGLSFEYDMVGHEPSACETACFYITDIRAETLASEDLDVYEGWVPGKGRIAFSGSGYLPGSSKTAVLQGDGTASSFSLVDTLTGRVALKKETVSMENENGAFSLLDFSEIDEPGEYLIVCGDVISRSFPISADAWEDSIWKTLNLLLCERCGYEVPGKHGVCHTDTTITHNGKSIIVNGGWHDAGDMTQTTTNTAECTYALFELLHSLKKGSALYKRVLEEAKWGLDWVIKTRFGDGYRVPSSSKSCWSDGILGTDDDITREAALEPIENFMSAAAEAIAARTLKEYDPILAAHSLKCAKEDWRFAYINQGLNGKVPTDDPNRIYTPLLMYAAGAWSAIELFDATGDMQYRDRAAQFAEKIMDCQQQEIPDWNVPFTGFFYDDTTKRLIQHFSHRSHEHEPVQALTRLCAHFPDHPDYPKWRYAVALYTDYMKRAYSYTAPYFVAPASIYHEDEAFHNKEYDMGMIQQFIKDEDDRRENYKKQVQSGVPLGKGYYLRKLSVAFAHRGNHALTLSGGQAAAEIAALTGDFALSELAQRQKEWIVGRNPFAESVMFGEGYDYCSEYAVLPGEMVGELGVGFACLDEHDSPFWPQVNTCVYKEVWIKPSLHWIWISAKTQGGATLSGVLPDPSEPIVLESRLSGRKIMLAAQNETGYFEKELPAGEYMVSCKGKSAPLTLLPGQKRRLSFPLYHADVSAVEENGILSIRAVLSEPVAVSIALQNLRMTGEQNIQDGTELLFTAEIENTSKPFFAELKIGENSYPVYGWPSIKTE